MKFAIKSEALLVQLMPNDTILVDTGEAVCTDGLVFDNHSQINKAMLTGESLPVKKKTMIQ